MRGGAKQMANCAVCGKGNHYGIKVSHSHRRSNRVWKSNIKRVSCKVNGTPRCMCFLFEIRKSWESLVLKRRELHCSSLFLIGNLQRNFPIFKNAPQGYEFQIISSHNRHCTLLCSCTEIQRYRTLVHRIISFWYIDAGWLFHMQGGGMRRSGGYVDWRQRSRWKIRQVNMAVT